MAEILTELRADHANMTRLLDALERQLAIFRQGEQPDYAFIAGLIEYCQGYPDRYHHPREDLIVEAMRARRPESVADVEKLEAEHAQINTHTQRFADMVEQVMQDQEMPREGFLTLAEDFVQLYRRHLAWEEETVFPRAEAVLSEADWQAIDARLATPEDPLFGGTEVERYKELRRLLMASELD